MQHIIGGFKSGVVVGGMAGMAKGVFLYVMGYLLNYVHTEKVHCMDRVDLSIIWFSIMTIGYSGVVGGLLLGFIIGLFYLIRGYRPVQINLDIMCFAILCSIFIFVVIEVKTVQYWVSMDTKIGIAGLWTSILLLVFFSYILYRVIRWSMHNTFVARLSFMLLYRKAFYVCSTLLFFSTIISLTTSFLNIAQCSINQNGS